MNNQQKWFVFYTKSRHEKKVNDYLVKSGYTPFLPLQTTVRQWSDRKKKVVTPLFNSYIFVRAFEQDIQNILVTPGVSWNVRYNGKPAVLHPDDLELIKRFVATGLFIEAVPTTEDLLQQGDRVIVRDGPLAGISGVLRGGVINQRFTVEIPSIHQVLKIQLPVYLLEKLHL